MLNNLPRRTILCISLLGYSSCPLPLPYVVIGFHDLSNRVCNNLESMDMSTYWCVYMFDMCRTKTLSDHVFDTC